MKHTKVIERLEQAKSATIEQLIWISAQFESQELTEFIQELDDDNWNKLFPEINQSIYFGASRDDVEWIRGLLVDFNYLGLVAKINIPIPSQFGYTKGKPTFWSSSAGYCRIEYVYADTLGKLLSDIEKIGNKVFGDYVEQDKARSKKEDK